MRDATGWKRICIGRTGVRQARRFEEFFRPPQVSEPAQALELPLPEGPPDVSALVATLEQRGVEVVGPPGTPLL